MIKLEHNWRSKNLENLEKEPWGEPEYDSSLVLNCHRLWRLQLMHFNVEDLRLMIGQNLGLDYLIPLAIENLEKDALISGDMYPGDLLRAVCGVKKDFWFENSSYLDQINNIIDRNKDQIDHEDLGIKRIE